ncbi:MAG: type II/IV secretion system ATPase subunit [Nanoarchaeota archaeon]|nr:type II/IV secretion system ATPase subunit [Nanoarchaeota archaeon]
MKARVIKLGKKKYLLFEPKEEIILSLSDPTFFRELFERLEDHSDVDGIIINKNYKWILDGDSFEILKEYVEFISGIKENEKLCDDDFEKITMFKLIGEENPIEAIRYFNEIKYCDKDVPFFKEIESKLKKTKMWKSVKQNSEKSDKEIYHIIFKERVVPGFITYFLEPTPEDAEIISKYFVDGAEVLILQKKEVPAPIYTVKPKELKLSHRKLQILNDAFEKLSEEEFDVELSDKICKKVIDEVAGDELSEDEKKELVKILKRYSFGYGIIEVLLKDPKIQDVYVDSPGNKPIYIYHEDLEECITNVILTPEELDKLSTRFRMISGRPFDESYPVLHAEIKELGVRVAGITEPMTFSGIGFAFRKHSVRPWTLQRFIKNKMLTAEAAGLISFLIDNQQSMLITGPRGSGKTSFLSAILAEIPQKFRVITIEDTPELPVDELKDLGFNIQHIRVKSTLQREAYEVTAEEALRNALRLGESVLVIGEVRGEEAKALFEAMRIGAAGNVVLGTIHGSSAYDVWDRIVNDLNVPSTSFKATNFVLSCAPIRKGESLKRVRRVVGLTEVLKYWKEDPLRENGFLELFEYDSQKDKLEIKNLKKSVALKEIISKRGMSFKDAISSIKTRAKIKEEIVKASESNPALLDVKFAIAAVNKFHELTQSKEKVNYKDILREFKKWLVVQQKNFK